MTSSGLTFLVFLFALIFLVLIVLGISDSLQRKKKREERRRSELAEKKDSERRSYIENNDLLIEQLKLLNVRYYGQFDNSLQGEYRCFQKLQAKSQFDSFSPENHLEKLILSEPSFYEGILDGVLNNRKQLNSYLCEFTQLRLSQDVPADNNGLFDSKEQYLEIRNTLFEQWKLSPRTEVVVTVTWTYRSPAGRNTYCDSQSFGIEDLNRLFQQAKECARAEKDRYEAASYQRSLMTPKLRFEVLKRDGYRCRVCGRSRSEGAQLEVDHIVPVSKGGKTIMSNLQTLCRECNRGKAARSM